MLVDVVGPEFFEVFEALEELLDFVTGSLDRTGKEQNNLHDFFIDGNHFVESFVFAVFFFAVPF